MPSYATHKQKQQMMKKEHKFAQTTQIADTKFMHKMLLHNQNHTMHTHLKQLKPNNIIRISHNQTQTLHTHLKQFLTNRTIRIYEENFPPKLNHAHTSLTILATCVHSK